MVENPGPEKEKERKARVEFRVRDETWNDLRQIAETHDLREYEAARLLMKLGIKAYREGRGLVKLNPHPEHRTTRQEPEA